MGVTLTIAADGKLPAMIRKSGSLEALSPVRSDPMNDPPDEFVWAFIASMPPHYRGYEPTTMRSHATIAYQRRVAPVRVGVFRKLAGGGVAICVVAADRPGLLSLIAASLTSHDLDVIAAQIYTRTLPSGQSEAIDLFWLRRRPLARSRREITSEEIADVESLLSDLMVGDQLASKLLEQSTVEIPYSAPGMTSVRFEEDQRGAAVLVVQTFDRPGLLLTISRCLFCLDVQVVRSDVSTSQGRVLDRFHLVDFDGRAIPVSRKAIIEAEVLGALENLGRMPS
jgi:UTP:GlnB (protein PII) uridylyltransferase